MSKDYDIPNLSGQQLRTRQRVQSPKKEKPLALRLFLCLLSVIIFFALGYGLFYAQKFQSFLAANTGQKVTVKTKHNTPLPTIPEPTNQTNILLLGSDNDQKFSGSNPLTQTMMVVHINYDKKTVYMFSIPRDLWIQKPDGTYGKIDQAAEENGIPSAIAAVEQTFGINIDHYAWVGLYGFIKSIDAVGGVNLQVIHPV